MKTSTKLSPLAMRAMTIIKLIPKGKVLTYGEVAKLISAPGCSRHISYILSSSSKKYELPWYRVLNSKGKISLPVSNGYFRQKRLLEREGILFKGESLSLENYLWRPSKSDVRSMLKGLPKHIPLASR